MSNAVVRPDFVDYTARDYNTISQSLIDFIRTRFPNDITDFTDSDIPIMLVQLLAYTGDLLSYNQDKIAQEAYISTAEQLDSVIKLVELINYIPTTSKSSSVNLDVFTKIGGLAQDVTVFKGTLIRAGSLTFEVTKDLLIPAGTVSLTGDAGIQASEGITRRDIFIGNGQANQEFVLLNKPVVQDSIKVRVAGTVFNFVSALVLAGDTNAFTYSVLADGTVTIRFGDAISGKIPKINDNISVDYRTGGGKIGDIAVGLINQQIPAIQENGTSVNITVTNTVRGSGGEDGETLDHIKIFAPRTVTTNGRGVTIKDFNTLASSFSDPVLGTIAKAVVVPRHGRTNSAANEIDVYTWSKSNNVFVNTSNGLKESLANFLNQKKIATIDIFVRDGLINPIDIDVSVIADLSIKELTEYRDDVTTTIKDFFNRDAITPGKTFRVSELYKAIMNTTGISSVYLGVPNTSVSQDDSISSSFVIGLTTRIELVEGGLDINGFASGSIKLTSGSLINRSFPILNNKSAVVICDAILSTLVPGDTFTVKSIPDCLRDVPTAENELYTLGDLTVTVFALERDVRSFIEVT